MTHSYLKRFPIQNSMSFSVNSLNCSERSKVWSCPLPPSLPCFILADSLSSLEASVDLLNLSSAEASELLLKYFDQLSIPILPSKVILEELQSVAAEKGRKIRRVVDKIRISRLTWRSYDIP